MMRGQRGISMLGILLIAALVIFAALGAMRVAPAYLEYNTVKKTVTAIASGGELRNGTVADVRRAFDRRAAVDDITAVGSQDLEITKDGGEIVISFAYPKRVPLFGNVSLLIEFAGSSNR